MGIVKGARALGFDGAADRMKKAGHAIRGRPSLDRSPKVTVEAGYPSAAKDEEPTADSVAEPAAPAPVEQPKKTGFLSMFARKSGQGD